MGNFVSYFRSPSTGESATPPEMDICFIYTHGISLDITHGGIKEVMDTNLLEVAGTVAACDHLDFIRTT